MDLQNKVTSSSHQHFRKLELAPQDKRCSNQSMLGNFRIRSRVRVIIIFRIRTSKQKFLEQGKNYFSLLHQ